MATFKQRIERGDKSFHCTNVGTKEEIKDIRGRQLDFHRNQRVTAFFAEISKFRVIRKGDQYAFYVQL
jgi:hypothetical protein